MLKMPERWSDYSLDYKLFFVLAFGLLLLFGVGGMLPVTTGFSAVWVATAIAAPLIIISVVHRARRQWRWRGVKRKDLVGALFGVAVVLAFLYAATPMFPPVGVFLPWYLLGGAIGVWNLLTALKITHYARADFDRDCEPWSVSVDEDGYKSTRHLGWRDVVAIVYSVLFFSVWLAFLARFYLTGVHLRDGARIPDATHVYAVEDDPAVAYISAEEGRLFEALGWYAFAGIPAIMLLGVVLQFIFKVPVLGNLGASDHKDQ
jgi:hypothetical protein